MSKGLGSRNEKPLPSQRWDNLSINKNNNCNWVKQVNCIKLHEFIKKKKKKTCSFLKDARNQLIILNIGD